MARQPKAVEGVFERVPGSGFWYARYRTNGKLVRKAFGDDRASAIRYVEKARTVRRTGEGVIPSTAKLHVRTMAELDKIGGQVTVGELCDDLLQHIKARPEEYKDQRNPPQRIARVKDKFGQRPAAAIRPFEVDDWLDELKGTLSLKPATLNRLKATISAAYRLGKHRDKVQVNPARDVKQRNPGRGVVRFLSADEEDRLRTVLQKDIDNTASRPQRQKHMVHRICELDVALGTGMRKGEQYGLRWPDVDFDRRVIQLRDTKNGEGREVEMIDDVMDAMRRLQGLGMTRKDREIGRANPAPEEAVFGIGDNKRWWEAALKRAKIQNFRWHDLRHTFCSRLAQNSASLKLIQEAAGHKTIVMSARYAHLDKTNLRSALAVLNRAR